MPTKIVTVLLLIMFTASVFLLWRQRQTPTWLYAVLFAIGWIPGISVIYLTTASSDKLSLLLLLSYPLMFAGLLLSDYKERTASMLPVDNDQTRFIAAIMLGGLGILTVYALPLKSRLPLIGVTVSTAVTVMAHHFCGLGLALLQKKYRIFRRLADWAINADSSRPFFVMTFLLTIAPFFMPQNGYLKTGFLGGGLLQPMELAKIFLIIGMTVYLKNSDLNFRSIAVCYLLIGLSFFFPLAMTKEYGSSMVFSLFAMIFFCSLLPTRERIVLLSITLLLFIAALGIGSVVSDRVYDRVVKGFLFWKDNVTVPAGNNPFQAWALALRNGLQGAGLGQVVPIPGLSRDYTISAIVATLGFWGVCLILSLFFFICRNAFAKTTQSEYEFEKLLHTAIGLYLIFVIYYVVSSAFALVPSTGLPMPLISRGGSSVIVSYLMIALLNETDNKEVYYAKV